MRASWAALFFLFFSFATATAGAVDLDELKRLARQDATAQAQLEAAEKVEQLKKEAENRQANQQQAPKPAALSGTASQMDKLARGIEAAHAAAPNKWYQAARIEDFTPPGDDQRKIYKITGVLGEYCLRYKDKNKADQGLANVGEALISACPHMF